MISLGVRLEKFNLTSVAGITMTDELDLPSLGEKKTALFCIIPDNDSSFSYLVGMIYTQLFQLFIRGERPVMDEKYDILKHPNIKLSADGGAPAFQHGDTPHALDWQSVTLHPDGDYELLSEEELEKLYLS